MHDSLMLLCGSKDAVGQLNSGLAHCEVAHCALSDCLSLCRAERPSIVVLEMHARWTHSDTSIARELLQSLRTITTNRPKVVLYLSSSLGAYHAGSLLFRDETSIEPSGLVDAFVVKPPLGALEAEPPNEVTQHLVSLFTDSAQALPTVLPSLGQPNWAPTLAATQSLSLWLQWLPRYARYVNESALIVGETGTGKTSLAAALHTLSQRQGPFVSITPRDFSSAELVQAELFGAVAGAYTGAVDKWGLVRKAEGGTLFIDELQSIDVELQGKLITFIEDKRYRRVGAAEQHSADVRFVFASNKPLSSLVQEGKLRDDFAYRLERLQLPIPPLRQRRGDVLAAACRALAMIQRVRPRRDSLVEGFTQEAFHMLFAAPWPGNLRQLENVVAHCVETTLALRKKRIDHEQTRLALENSLGGYEAKSEEVLARSLEQVLAAIRRGEISTTHDAASQIKVRARELALEATAGDIQRAARLLGEQESTLSYVETLRHE